MTWSSPRSWTTAEFITRSIFQTAVRDEFLQTAPAKAAAKGDTFFASGANAIGALSVGANDTQLKADSAATLGASWGSENNVPIRLTLPTNDIVFDDRLAAGAAAWPAANRAIFVPFYLGEAKTLDKIHLVNGTVSGNVDVGVYDAAGAKIVTKGTTAQAGANVEQVFDVANTALAASTLYYAAVALDNGTGQIYRSVPGIAQGQLHGLKQMASAFVLPSSVTYAAIASDYCPVIVLEFAA